MLTYKSKRWEISSVGPDADLQLVGSDASGASAWLGLPIPASTISGDRYSFLVSVARFGIGERAKLRGMRQLVEIGAYVPTGDEDGTSYPLKRLVTTPNWRFVDGNIMWSLRRLRPQISGYYNSANQDGLQWRTSLSPAQLFETITSFIAPPYNGLFPGDSLEPNLTEFFDLRFPWTSDNAADILDSPITGPCMIALFASVLQTNPVTRAKLPGAPGTFSTNTGITPEDAFVGNYPTANYTRVAGSLIFEWTEGGPAIKPGAEKCPPRPDAPMSAIEEHYDGRA